MVTLKDVARRANVSIATVSLVLNNKPAVAEDTRARVLACAEEMDYRPNVMARGIKTSITKAIGVVVPTITNPVYPNIVHGIEISARSAGYQVILCSYSGERLAPIGTDCLSELHDRMVDGIIICGVPEPMAERGDRRATATVQSLVRRGTPFVFLSDQDQVLQFAEAHGIDLDRHGDLFHTLMVDRVDAAFGAVSHLVHIGHRRIGLIDEDTKDRYPNNIPFLRKLEGYKSALSEGGLLFDDDLVVGEAADFDGGKQGCDRLLSGDDPPTAVFCTGDVLALGALRAARQRDLRVPQDLAVIGFDGIPLGAYFNPTLSTIALPTARISQEAFRRLGRLMNGERVLPTRAVFDTELVIRESCP